MENNYTKVGALQKSFGTEGFLKYKIFNEFKDDFIKATFIWINHDDYYVPYRVTGLKVDKRLIQFDDVFTNEAAEKIHNKSLYLLSHEMTTVQESDEEIFVGFELYDQDKFIATIEEVREIAGFLYAVITWEEKEKLIPIHEDLVEELDPDKNILRMNLPEGILDL